MTLPKSIRIALREDPDGLLTTIPLDDYLTARREDPGITERLGAIHLLELLMAAADRLDALQTPTIPIPVESREIGQCPAAVLVDGTGAVSRCLRLDHPDTDPHENGNLRWRELPSGEIERWWHDQPWEEIGLGDLIRREGITVTFPHHPSEAPGRITADRPALDGGPTPVEDQR